VATDDLRYNLSNISYFFGDRATFAMGDANATVGHLQGLLTKPLERAITATLMG
jgi:hypothetical protein